MGSSAKKLNHWRWALQSDLGLPSFLSFLTSTRYDFCSKCFLPLFNLCLIIDSKTQSHPVLEPENESLFHVVWRSESLNLFCSLKSLTTSMATHPDVGCGYLVFWTLRKPMEIDLLHPDKRSENLSILLLFLLSFEIGLT